jgi:hypothetical protein
METRGTDEELRVRRENEELVRRLASRSFHVGVRDRSLFAVRLLGLVVALLGVVAVSRHDLVVDYATGEGQKLFPAPEPKMSLTFFDLVVSSTLLESSLPLLEVRAVSFATDETAEDDPAGDSCKKENLNRVQLWSQATG